MPIPDYQELMLPLLTMLAEAKTPSPVRAFVDPIADKLGLTPEERAVRIPSGQENLLANRLAWARTYMGKAGLIASPKRGLVQITDQGRSLLAQRPSHIDNKLLSRYAPFAEWLAASQEAALKRRTAPESRRSEGQKLGLQSLVVASWNESASGAVADTAPHGQRIAETLATPRERIDQAMAEIEAALQDELLARTRQMTPSDFEGLILRLLLAMGYGQGLARLIRDACQIGPRSWFGGLAPGF